MQAEAVISDLTKSAAVLFSEETFDRKAWLQTYWGLNRPFSLQHQISDTVSASITGRNARDVTVHYDVQIYTVKFDQIGGRFGMVNNIGIDDPKSTHFLVVSDSLKIALSGFIKDSLMRKFFIDEYRVSIFLAVDVKFPGAEYSGTTKNAFISREFRNIYEPSVRARLSEPGGMAFVAALYQELASDIEDKYTKTMTGVTPVKNRNRLFEEFDGLSDRFSDPTTSDRSKAEVFFVEGSSAGGSEGCDRETQGIYDLNGKPYNAVRREDKVRESLIALLDKSMWKEIVAITGLDPKKFNREALHFGKAWNIMTDADDHGYHIASIMISDFYVLNPDILNSGIVQLVLPPLYSLEYKGARRNKEPRVYLRDENELEVWMATKVYMDHYDISIRSDGLDNTIRRLRDKQCVDFLRIILAIGEAISSIADELVLSDYPLVVERLTRITAYLEPGQVDVVKINEILGIDKVSYVEADHILILTIGRNDHIVPLQNVRKRLLEAVLPVMNRIQWRTTQIYITPKRSSEGKDIPVSIMDLYARLRKLDGQFKIRRYKGLGDMPAEDKKRTCFEAESSNIRRITSIGDVRQIFDMLGDDSAPRKRLLRRFESDDTNTPVS